MDANAFSHHFDGKPTFYSSYSNKEPPAPSCDVNEVKDLPFVEFIGAVTQFMDVVLTGMGKLDLPHPWLNLLLPQSCVQEVVTRALQSPYLHGDEPIILYPIPKQLLQCPNLTLPEGEVIYLFSVLHNVGLSASPDIPIKVILEENEMFYKLVKELGGCRYRIL